MIETNTLKDGTIITGFKNDFITNVLRTTQKYYEYAMLEFIKSNIPKGVMVDVGANIGNHTIYFAKYCATGVIAFEPFPDTFNLLQRNIHQNYLKNVQAINLGLSNESKELTMKSVEGNAGMNKIDMEGTTPIQVTSFYYSASEPITLIKLDCEGYECKAIQGMIDTITEHKPAIFVECQTEQDLANILTLLSPLGYQQRYRFNHTPTYYLSI